ncbi:MAG TPA: hypothetical protein VHY08_00295 [Bacillota bacterium]|nr:hypothetical protein [Bacillota bacterium]
MSSPEEETIRELLKQKVNLFEMLLSCAKQQSEILFLDDSVKYENIIQTRAGIIDELKKIDLIINHNLEVKPSIQGDLEQQIKATNDQVADIVRQIINEDQKSRTSMDRDFQVIKNKLQVIQKGKKGLSAYGANPGLSPGGVYTDSKR